MENEPISYVLFDPATGKLLAGLLQVPPEDHENRIEVDDETRLNWPLYRANDARDGVELAPTPAANVAEIVQGYEAQVDLYLNQTAWLYGYNDLLSAISYAEEPAVPAFQIEGLAFRAWRSLVWVKCREILAEYNRGEREAPTPESLIAELPTLDLPPPALGRVSPSQQQ